MGRGQAPVVGARDKVLKATRTHCHFPKDKTIFADDVRDIFFTTSSPSRRVLKIDDSGDRADDDDYKNAALGIVGKQRVSRKKKMKSRKTLMRGERVVQTLITRVILMVPNPGKGRGSS